MLKRIKEPILRRFKRRPCNGCVAEYLMKYKPAQLLGKQVRARHHMGKGCAVQEYEQFHKKYDNTMSYDEFFQGYVEEHYTFEEKSIRSPEAEARRQAILRSTIKEEGS